MTAWPQVSGSRRQLLDRIRRMGTRTVDQLVADVGLAKNTVRTHLLKMEQLGLIERISVGTRQPGRPPLAYRVGPAGIDTFPRSEGELLTALIAFLQENGAQDLLEAFFQRVWDARRGELEGALATIRGRGLKARLRALHEVLDRNHFMPVIEISSSSSSGRRGDRKLTIRECNCPDSSAVRATRLPCELEAQFLGHVVGTPPTSVRVRTTDAEPCIFEWESLCPKFARADKRDSVRKPG